MVSPPVLPRAFLGELGDFGGNRAVVAPGRTLTHRELAEATDAFARTLGDGRRLVLMTARNDLASLIAYLAVLGHGHVAMMASNAAHARALTDRFRPDTVIDHGQITHRATIPGHTLHPDLALLLSTSGTTGSPKLIRLSHDNLRSNAEAIATYLRLSETDLAATTLPPHYCYGLSVLHSHLQRGAGVMLTDRSVTDAAFWEEVRGNGATSFAGVPYTFELLDRIGFDHLDLPTLRHVTQAGGRLAPESVRRFAALGRERGFDFFVMYGATEATARMAWLPPHLAAEHPDAIGVPVDGGHFEIRGDADLPEGTGELVYHGPNVMLGYAETPDDFGLGRTVDELRTGDLGRRGDDGLFRVIGRRARFAKLFGLRVDLDACERELAAAGITAKCADGDDHLAVAAVGESTDSELTGRITRVAGSAWGLPASAVNVVSLPEFPRLPNGKVDYRSVVALAEQNATTTASPPPAGEAEGTGTTVDLTSRVADLFATTLGTEVGLDDSFTTLGGDSLSYVEVSVQLEQILGVLPEDWHRMSIFELGSSDAPSSGGRRRRWRSVDGTVPLRAIAITAIVATHGNLLTLVGGAHLLLAISGFNFARFAPQGSPRHVLTKRFRSIARIVLPSVVWIAAVTLLLGTYPWRTVFLVNGLVGPRGWSEPAWHYWFIEALVVTLAALAVLTALPWWARLDRRWPFALPFAIACLGLVTRYELWEPRAGDNIHRAHVIFWLFAIGWATARATRHRHRIAVSLLAVVTVPGFFEDALREAFVVVGLLLLIWMRNVTLPAPLASACATLASASLYIYLTHWQIYPWLEHRVPLVAVAASLGFGVLVSQAEERLPKLLGSRSTRRLPAAAPARDRGAAAP